MANRRIAVGVGGNAVLADFERRNGPDRCRDAHHGNEKGMEHDRMGG
jgi:hypothetical protein